MPPRVPPSTGVPTANSDRARDVGSAEAEKPCLAESQPAASGLSGACTAPHRTAPSSVKVFGDSISLGNVLGELIGKRCEMRLERVAVI